MAALRQWANQGMILLAVLAVIGALGVAAYGIYRGIRNLERAKSSTKTDSVLTESKQSASPLSQSPDTGQSANHSPEQVSATRRYPESFRRFRPIRSVLDLKNELAAVPEITLESKPGKAAEALTAHAQANHGTWMKPAPFPSLLQDRFDLPGLPFGKNAECYLWDGPAFRLESLSKALHEYLDEAEVQRKQFGYDATAGYLNSKLAQDGDSVWRVPEAVPALVQIL